jgi:transposase
MPDITITSDEERILKGYKRKAREILIQAKSEAVLLAAAGVSADIISSFTDRAPSTIEEWLRRWNRERLGSVVTGHAGNLNASKLTAAQRAQAAAVLSRPPAPDASHALPPAFWDVPQLAEWLRTEFDVVYESPSSYHFLLRMAGLSFHKPDPLDKRRDDAAVETRIAEIRAEIAPLIADPGWEVWAADEVRIDQEADIRRAWLPQGAKAIVKVDRARQAQSYIGFLHQDTGACRVQRLPWQNGPEILAALEALVAASPGKRIAIVWDNAAWHKTKLIRAQLAKGGTLEQVHLIAMPPYAPDHNPIEHVWKAAKDHAANIQQRDFDETLHKFENYIASRQFNYRL